MQVTDARKMSAAEIAALMKKKALTRWNYLRAFRQVRMLCSADT